MAAVIYIALVVIGWKFLQTISFENRVLADLTKLSFHFAYIIFAIIGASMLLVLLGTPTGARKIHDNLWRVGLTNHAGENPLLIRKYTEKNEIIMEFEPCGIPLKEWQDKKERIETALNIHVLKITHGKNRKRILLHTVSGEQDLPEILHCKDAELSKKDFELVLGQSFGGKVKVNLTKVPHILLGRSTGSGKSVLLKLILMQCVKKGAEVYIADFKGGVDFSPAWHLNCKIITEETELLDVLTMIVEELENRKVLFRESGCANLTEYQKYYDAKRYIFACDEVAEVLDKTGLSKEQKELVTKIESKLSVIARQGRAFGIHLILATQRPDANILSGQIRNNIDYRVCGRADNVLSQIILDNTAASDEIPKDAQGLFLNHEGTIFRAYLFDEEWK
ncbi:MAG: hypothetical protein IJM95_07905 [Anaerotignum sp.]|nr:hypothetical protein [Anaerotignum sp.]